MRDPDIVFMFHALPDGLATEPVSFRNDYIGLCQEVYRYDDSGKRTHLVPRLKRELKSFSITWFRNLYQQGFLAPRFGGIFFLDAATAGEGKPFPSSAIARREHYQKFLNQ